MIKPYHTKKEILKLLDTLTEEQIEQARLVYNKENVIDYITEDLFAIALNKKQREKRYCGMMKAIEKVKNAPSSATNTEQGNATDNLPQKSDASAL